VAEAPVRLERDGAVAALVLEDPPLNLFRSETFAALNDCLKQVEISDARAMVWRAEGEVFSGGVDVHLFDQTSRGGSNQMFGALLATVRKVESLPIPTVALVQGLCLTAGLEISLGCDMILASESAKFGLVEAVVGLTPGAGGTQRIAERAGPARAREFVMTGGLYDAATLESWNVVNRVLPDAELMAEGMKFVQRLAAGPTKAHAATKRIIRAYLEGGVDKADRETPKVAASLFETEDLKNAVRSFLEQGPGNATFGGR
jgi:enoyl-CoA hydratase/carnithine racemase